MGKITFKLNYSGVQKEILNADFVLDECKQKCEQEAKETWGSGNYHMKNFKGTQRAHSIAYENTKRNPG